MKQFMMYFEAEIGFWDDNTSTYVRSSEQGFIYAPSLKEAGEWAASWYGDEILSIKFEPLEEAPIFVSTKEMARAIMEEASGIN